MPAELRYVRHLSAGIATDGPPVQRPLGCQTVLISVKAAMK